LQNESQTPRLQISGKICGKEGQGIFDYESHEYYEKSFTVNRSVNVFRTNREIFIKNENFLSNDSSLLVSQIKSLSDGYSIRPLDFRDDSKSMWLVTKPDVGRYELQVNDVIRIGRVKLVVKDMEPKPKVTGDPKPDPEADGQITIIEKDLPYIDTLQDCMENVAPVDSCAINYDFVAYQKSEEALPPVNHPSKIITNLFIEDLQSQTFTDCPLQFQPDSQTGSVQNTSRKSDNIQATCRICLSSGCSEDDPLLNFCKCTGSLKYSH
jgi:hypothetical protein